MEQTAIDPELVELIAQCILATKFPSSPRLYLEHIMCDADTYDFGTPYFRETEFLVKKEIEMRTGKLPVNWTAESIRLLQHHRYYTDYCQQLLNKGKEENIKWLASLL